MWVPEENNLQYVAFWAAKACGSFAREHLDVVAVASPTAVGALPAASLLERGDVDAVVATPEVYLGMIGADAPVVVVANLFANDPYALVVRREVAEARKFSADASLRERVNAVRGMSIGYAPASVGRLRSLLASQGVDFDKDLTPHLLAPWEETTAFPGSETDAAYLASPQLERAVVASEAWVLVNQARGEVRELANRQTHVLVVSRRTVEQRRDVVLRLVRAIGDAEARIHAARSEVVDALSFALKGHTRETLETALALYEPAVPSSPAVRVEALLPALALLPEGVSKPNFRELDLTRFVASDLAAEATNLRAKPEGVAWRSVGMAVFLLFGVILVVRRRRAR